jgi:hypothetical protein
MKLKKYDCISFEYNKWFQTENYIGRIIELDNNNWISLKTRHAFQLVFDLKYMYDIVIIDDVQYRLTYEDRAYK